MEQKRENLKHNGKLIDPPVTMKYILKCLVTKFKILSFSLNQSKVWGSFVAMNHLYHLLPHPLLGIIAYYICADKGILCSCKKRKDTCTKCNDKYYRLCDRLNIACEWALRLSNDEQKKEFLSPVIKEYLQAIENPCAFARYLRYEDLEPIIKAHTRENKIVYTIKISFNQARPWLITIYTYCSNSKKYNNIRKSFYSENFLDESDYITLIESGVHPDSIIKYRQNESTIKKIAQNDTEYEKLRKVLEEFN